MKSTDRLIKILAVALAVLVCAIAGLLFLQSREKREVLRAVETPVPEAHLEQEIVATPEPTPSPEPTSTPEPTPTPAPWDTVRQSAKDFAQLKARYPDICMWIEAEGTQINYPVMSATDNDYYLHHAPDGSYSVAGTLFTDCMNLPDLGSDCTVIYGHHMADGSMFQNLMFYKDQKYTDEHPYIKIYTPAGDYNLEVFAGVYYNGGTDRLYFDFASDEQFVMYCENLKAKSAISSDVEINAGDKIIGLCTCTYEFDNARYVVYGKLNAADLS